MTNIVLLGLLRAYIGGDLVARRVLLDCLEEEGDERLDAVRHEAIDWNKVAWSVCPRVSSRRSCTHASHTSYHSDDLPRYRWYVDCARVGSFALPNVVSAVQEARRQWLQELFPEVSL